MDPIPNDLVLRLMDFLLRGLLVFQLHIWRWYDWMVARWHVICSELYYLPYPFQYSRDDKRGLGEDSIRCQHNCLVGRRIYWANFYFENHYRTRSWSYSLHAHGAWLLAPNSTHLLPLLESVPLRSILTVKLGQYCWLDRRTRYRNHIKIFQQGPSTYSRCLDWSLWLPTSHQLVCLQRWKSAARALRSPTRRGRLWCACRSESWGGAHRRFH